MPSRHTTRSTAKRTRDMWLVLSPVPHLDEVVIRTAADAIHDHQVHVALNTGQTWGEFRALLPTGEWDRVRTALLDEERESALAATARSSGDDPAGSRTWDRDEAPFSAWMLPGFPQRYPRWAQPRMHEIVPPSLLRRYGTEVPLFEPFQGSYWSIRVDRAEALASHLRRRGYHVEWSDVLKGY
mgnify:CR=1 FL=1